ncbi:phage capsid protein [Candidatus Liberibacter solanacearum]|uniref:phage capsid protein n=1 Tax=Candidatus Liberibacter solanacearum TaxID=556287 RepID=UPI00387E0FF6
MGVNLKKKVLLFDRSAVVLAIWQDIKTRVSLRGDRNNNGKLFLSMMLGATRVDESRVAQILVG